MRVMKTMPWFFAIFAAGIMTFVGCRQQASVNTAPLQDSFKAAEPALQSSVEKVVAAVKGADYSGALAELRTMAKNTKLTPEQQQAIKDVLAQVETVIRETASKAAGEAGKALDDVKKSLPK